MLMEPFDHPYLAERDKHIGFEFIDDALENVLAVGARLGWEQREGQYVAVVRPAGITPGQAGDFDPG